MLRQTLLNASLKEVTVRKYEGQLKQYLAFAGRNPLFELWSDESGAEWILHCLQEQNLAKSTLKGRIPAFAFGVFKYTGRRCDTGKDNRYSLLGMVNRAIERRPDDVRRKIAVGKESLTKCFPHLSTKFDATSAMQLWAWWIVSYGAMLRCSETARIRWEDVTFGEETNHEGIPKNMLVTIRSLEETTFKTHQCAVELRFAAVKEVGICPVRAMWAWQQMTSFKYGGISEQAFSFSVDSVRQAFQSVMAATLGGEPRDFGLHSLRAGAATDAEAEGWSISEIMFMGRWRSPTVLVYLRQGDQWLHQLHLPSRAGTTVRPTLYR